MFEKIDKHLTRKALVFFLIFLGSVLYLNSFFNEFVWDDDDILRNVYLKDWRNIPQYFSHNLIDGSGQSSNYWRPLLLVSFSVDWYIGKYQPILYHLHNLFLHILAAITLFLIFWELSRRKYLSFFISLIFLIHPLQTEAVTYISGRADPLAALFIFLSLLFFIKTFEHKPRINFKLYGLSVFCFILALLSRETAMMTPFLAVLLMLSFPEKFFSENILSWPWKKRISEVVFLAVKWTLPFLIIFVVFVSLRLTVLNFLNILNFWPTENVYTQNVDFRIYTFFRTILTYIGLVFLPLELHMERSVLLQMSLFSFPVLAGVFVFLGMVGWAVLNFFRNFPKNSIIFFGVGWFFITLAPYSNILIPINAIVYEHWMYLPLIGIFVCSFKFVEDFLKGRNSVFGKALAIFLVFYFGFFCIATILRNRGWRDPIVFYNQILKYNKTYRVYNNLGNAYMDIGDYKKSEESYNSAANIDPSSPQPEVYNNLGLLYSKQKRNDEAIFYYQKALKIKENYLPTIANLGELYQRKKDWEKAKEYYGEYARIVPYNPFGYFKLGEISYLEGKCLESSKYLEEAKKIAPQDDVAFQNTLSLLIEEAKKCIK